MTFVFAFLIGFLAGLRSLTAPAVVAWAVRLGWMRFGGMLSLIGSTVSVCILSVLAITELIFDKLPSTPNRTEPVGLIARMATGGVTGACVALSQSESAIFGTALGIAGGVTGCCLGYFVRTRLVTKLRVPDTYVALAEDLIAISGSLVIVTR